MHVTEWIAETKQWLVLRVCHTNPTAFRGGVSAVPCRRVVHDFLIPILLGFYIALEVSDFCPCRDSFWNGFKKRVTSLFPFANRIASQDRSAR